MCAFSRTEIKEIPAEMSLGYFGGRIYFDGKYYNDDDGQMEREDMARRLGEKLTKDELIELVLRFVDNGEEG